MRVLLISSSSGSRGGGEIFLRYLAKGLVSEGDEVAVWMSADEQMNELAAQLASDGVEVLRSRYRNTYHRPARSLSTKMPWQWKQEMLELWAAWKPDLLHVNKQNLEDGPDLVRAANEFSAPAVCTVHITQSQRSLGAVGGGIRDLAARRNLRTQKLPLAAVSDLRGEELGKFAGRDATVLYNGVPCPPDDQLASWRSETRATLGWEDGAVGFLGVGRMVAQKRPLEFVRLAEAIHQAHPEARFAWIGDGDLSDDWDRQAAGMGHLQRLPWQDSVDPWFAAADVFLHTAAFEGLPFAVVEALSHGLPTLLPDSVIQEAHPFQQAGVPCSDRPEDWLAEVCSPAFRQQQRDKSLNLHSRHFSLKAMALGHQEFYRRVVSEHK